MPTKMVNTKNIFLKRKKLQKYFTGLKFRSYSRVLQEVLSLADDAE
jgi:hypothetical protein